MAKINLNGYSAPDTEYKVHRGAGRLLGYIVSHKEASAQTVTFYDNEQASGKVLHKVHINPGLPPFSIRFSTAAGEEAGILFVNGLYVDAQNCAVSIWSVGFGE
jgi:hypothetical protein